MRADPNELTNLAGQLKYAPVIAELDPFSPQAVTPGPPQGLVLAVRSASSAHSCITKRLSALNTGTGREGLRPSTLGVVSTATITNDVKVGTAQSVLYVGGGDSKMYALNAQTGAVLWSHSVGSNPEYFLYSSPAVYGNSVHIGVASFGDCPLVQGQLLQLNRTTGAVQHVINLVPDGCVAAGLGLTNGGGNPLTGDGDAASGAWDGTTLYAGGDLTNIGVQGCEGPLNALNPSTGAFIWRHCFTDGFVLGGVTGTSGGVVAVGEGNNIAVLSTADGTSAKTFTGAGTFLGPPSIANGVLYEGDTSGNLYALTTK